MFKMFSAIVAVVNARLPSQRLRYRCKSSGIGDQPPWLILAVEFKFLIRAAPRLRLLHLSQVLRMIETSDTITLKDVANKRMKLDIKFDCGTNHQKIGEHNFIWKSIHIIVFTRMFPLSVNLQFNAGFVIIWNLPDFVHMNLMNAIFVVNEDTRKQCSE